MRAGLLRHRAVVQQYSESQDNSGDVVQSWSNYATRWVNIRPTQATEAYEADQSTHRATHEITMRYDDDITSTMRVTYGGKTLYLLGVINQDMRNVMMTWSASERVA